MRMLTARTITTAFGAAVLLGVSGIGVTAAAAPDGSAAGARQVAQPQLPCGYQLRELPNGFSRTLLPADWVPAGGTPQQTLILRDRTEQVRVQVTTTKQPGSARDSLLRQHEVNADALDDYAMKRFDDSAKNGYRNTAVYEYAYREGGEYRRDVVRGWQHGDAYIQIRLGAPEKYFEKFREVAEHAFQLEIRR